jgi:pyridoxal 5'-phosphate synthase pdxT subunit
MRALKVGILAFHGDVIEHARALEESAKNTRRSIEIVFVRTKESLEGLDALIIPGGESTTLYKLCEREDMISEMKKVKKIFGTCAGAIMLAKKVTNISPGQKTLGLLDIDIDRNAYGRQTDSFNSRIKTDLGDLEAVFIRAPRIKSIGDKVKVLAKSGGEIVACEENIGQNYYLAACLHPELTTALLHEYFLKKV